VLKAGHFCRFPAWAKELAGQVVGIHDSDTLTLLTPERRSVRVRLHAIDTPESRQPCSTRARQELSELVFRQTVRVEVMDTDRYGGTVEQVWIGNFNVNAELVRRGGAWIYRQYNHDLTASGAGERSEGCPARAVGAAC
jgi:endonuclease YncB( thermonuclease family)